MAFMNSNTPSNPYLAMNLWDRAEREEVFDFVANSQSDSTVAGWLKQQLPNGQILLHQEDALFAGVILLMDEVNRLRDRVSKLEEAKEDAAVSEPSRA